MKNCCFAFSLNFCEHLFLCFAKKAFKNLWKFSRNLKFLLLLLWNFKYVLGIDFCCFGMCIIIFGNCFLSLTFRVYSGTVVTSNLLATAKILQKIPRRQKFLPKFSRKQKFPWREKFSGTFFRNENCLEREQIFVQFSLFEKRKKHFHVKPIGI